MTRRLLLACALLTLSLPAWAATVRVTRSQAPLRAAAVESGAVLERLEKGTVLELVDVLPGWYKVRNPRTGKEGFILSSFVELLPGSLASPSTKPGAAESGAAAAGQAGAKPGTTAPGAKPAAAAPRKPARPPKPGDWRDKGFVTLSGLFQNAGSSFGYSFSPAQYGYAEQAHLTMRYPMKSGAAFDGGGGVRVWPNLAVGAALSVFSKPSSVSLNATIPHPLYLGRDRTVTGDFSSPRSETALHVQATWVVPAGKRMLVALSGGPSYFRVSQSIADSINVTSLYPYDTATFGGPQLRVSSPGAVGVNVGVDAAYFFTRTIGLGGLARYTHASMTFATPAGQVSTVAGGFQAGIGLRVRLGAPGPKKPQTPPKPATPPAKPTPKPPRK